MFLQIGAKPESDFSEPLGMLSDCHKRIQFFLKDLVRLAEIAEQPLDVSSRVALERALRYFQGSGPRHTADEEESLFPRLRAIKDDRMQQALAKISELEADHQRANAAHDEVDAIGRKWLQEGALRTEQAARLKSLLHDLSQLYEHHLHVEDTELFPAARRVLAAHDKTNMGREMAQRRGLSADIVKESRLGSGSMFAKMGRRL